MKGIILAGGSGTRLYPITHSTSKQLLPVYNKPMIYYAITTLLEADIRDILIITTPQDNDAFRRLLGDGSQWGIRLSYEIQTQPRGLADAFRVGKAFIQDSPVALILGDNLFYGADMAERLQEARRYHLGATVFAYHVADPERYGVVTFDSTGKALDIVEKPANPQSNWAVTGLYFYDNSVVDIAENLKPSPRGELEITDVNQQYLEKGMLRVVRLGKGYAWLDTGTHDSLLEAAEFVRTLEKRQGTMIGCPELTALQKGYVHADTVVSLAEKLSKNSYGQSLKSLLQERQGNMKFLAVAE